MKLKFTKMHGCGNDFVVVEDTTHIDWKSKAAQILDRHFGVGADQLLVLKKSPELDAEMLIFNSDGSQAEMCGNGIRAAARYIREKWSISKENLSFQTLGGIQKVSGESKDRFRVEMGKPTFDSHWGEEIEFQGKKLKIYSLSMGNPHVVIFVPAKDQLAWTTELGPGLEHHSFFPNRTNVEFVLVRDEKNVQSRVWERGVGETLACGSGACAIGVAAIRTSKTKSPVTVQFPGGNLEIEWSEGRPVFMTGPATHVFEGEIEV